MKPMMSDALIIEPPSVMSVEEIEAFLPVPTDNQDSARIS
jgi:hypothetical protein